MKTHLWKINKEKLNRTNLAKYSDFIKKNYSVNSANDFDKIWRWSIDNPKLFWKSIWDFTKVRVNKEAICFKNLIFFLKIDFSQVQI